MSCVHTCMFVYACLLLPVVMHMFASPRAHPQPGPSLFCLRRFSNIVLFNMRSPSAPLPPMSLQPCEPPTLLSPCVLCCDSGEQNLLLTETSSTIKVSSVGGLMPLKGFACTLGAGLGSAPGCHVCRPGMRQNGRVPASPPPSVYSHCAAWWAGHLRPVFKMNIYLMLGHKQCKTPAAACWLTGVSPGGPWSVWMCQ